MGVRLCSSARPRMLLEFENLNLPDFAQGSGQPLTAAWLCFMLKYGCQAPIAANAAVSGCGFLFTLYLIYLSVNQKIIKLLHFLEMLIFSKNICPE